MALAALLQHRMLVLAVILCLSVLFGLGTKRLEVNNTPEVWLPKGLPSLAEYERFVDQFGDDSMLLIFSEQVDFDSPDWPQTQAEYTAALKTQPGVARIISANDPLHPLAKHLANPEMSAVAWALKLNPELEKAERFTLLESLDALAEQHAEALPGLKMAGADFITRELDQGSKESLGKLSPLVFALLSGLLWWSTRSLKIVLAGLAAVSLTSVWALGLMGWSGQQMNLVLATIPAILAVITIAQMMHLVARFQAQPISPDSNGVNAWAQSIKETWRPCALSAITTAAGFASLGFSELLPVRNLGLFTAFGSMVSWLLVFSLAPALLSLLRAKPAPRRHAFSLSWLEKYMAWVQRWRIAIIGSALVLTLLSAWGVNRLRVESNILEFFPAQHVVPQHYHAAQDALFGLTPFELVLSGDSQVVFSNETAEALRDFVDQAIEAEPLLTQAVSAFPLDAPGNVDLPLLLNAPGIESYVQQEGGQATIRVSLLSRTSSSNACHALAQRLENALEDVFPAGVEAKLTGSATQLIAGQVLLLDTQIRSFCIALGVVTLVILLVFRSLPTLLLSLLPNLLPVALTLGFMGLFGIPLNTATVTVAGIALGLIVDDTLHLLYHYNLANKQGDAAPMLASIRIVARPIMITSVAVAVGFSAFALSPFRPTLYFGLLIAVTSLTAMVCDLLFLPALLQGKRASRD